MVHKTTLLVDDVKVRKAQAILGTTGIKDTVDRALDEVLANALRRRELDRLRQLKPSDLQTIKKAWR